MVLYTGPQNKNSLSNKNLFKSSSSLILFSLVAHWTRLSPRRSFASSARSGRGARRAAALG